MTTLLIIGRILFGILMFTAGFSHFSKYKGMVKMTKAAKMPLPGFSVFMTGIILLLGGLSFIFWYKIWLGTLLLLIFFILVTPTMHAFWKATTPEEKMRQTHSFMGNMSIIGLLLVILSFVG